MKKYRSDSITYDRLHALDLFSGIGGISLALQDYTKTVAYCEIEPYCQAILLERMKDNALDNAPIFPDIRQLTSERLREIGVGRIDIITGGFPCQDISVAGVGKGLDGERSGLFFEIPRLIRETQPSFVFLENVPAIRTRGAERVVKELAALGYDCRWDCLSAFDVGAPHKRERWFCLSRRRLPYSRREHDQSHFRCMEKASCPPWKQERRDGPERVGSTIPQPASVGWFKKYQNDSGNSEGSGEEGWSSGLAVGSNVGVYPVCKLRDSDCERLEKRTCFPCDIREEQPSPFRADWWLSEPDVGRVANGIPQRVDRIKSLGNAVVPQQVKEAFERLIGVK